MKKFAYIAAFMLIFGCVALASNCIDLKSKEKISSQHIGYSYTYAISQKKPFVVFFFTDWCSCCVNFMPTLRLIEAVYGNSYNIVMVNCEDSYYKPLVKEYKIESYPTLYIVDKNAAVKQYIEPDNYSDINKLRAVLDKYLEIEPE